MSCSGCKRALCASKFPGGICPLCARRCEYCGGSGMVEGRWNPHDGGDDIVECSECDGTGVSR